jgi:hypothetical protein
MENLQERIKKEGVLDMYNWFVDKNEIKSQTINAIMGELEYLVKEATEDDSANYWIDNTHNVFAFINNNRWDDRWIEIHYELYDCNDNMIGDLLVLDTEDVTMEDLLKEVKVIVDAYYGD